MIRKYLEISRLFNMGLTGVAPVLGALSMWKTGTTSLFNLLILFSIGCFSHIYGFVLNDIMDIRVDKLSKELTARPLVSGHITSKRAVYFAVFCMIISFLLSMVFFKDLQSYMFLLLFLIVGYLFATIYNMTSKKYPGMDLFVSGAVFFGILFGASTVGTPTALAWIVAFIGSVQVLFMNMINGAIKDIDHDEEGLANTLAIKLGARTTGGIVTLPVSFKVIGYGIELIRSVLIFLPFFLLQLPYQYWQIGLLILLMALTFFAIYRLFSIKTFDRSRIRKYIGIIVILMYATAPVMLSSLTLSIILVALIPPLWFISSNAILHKTILQPKTM